MIARGLLSIAVLPGSVLVVVPFAIFWVTSWLGDSTAIAHSSALPFWFALVLALPGTFISFWSLTLFFSYGDGTPAPWDPPKYFVIRGPYRHVRNPRILGVVLLLFAESLFFQSRFLAAWATLFFIGNAIYLPLAEEPGLAKRFGDDYIVYCENVNRWIPRLTPWKSEKGHDTKAI
ncbi:MAG: hypothetical protein A2156_10810 [Deltaproteobacteria bacterium RBG_16_48_10]|nr:MAG: hypothetical protein A2156_10810 [Deltaproteobacteria bacterium RBG_16_48_10]